MYTLSQTPDLRVGGPTTDPEDEFNAKTGALSPVLLSDGGLIVAEAVRIHIFDSVGNRRAILGRQGSGPEEFLNISVVCRTRGDTIVMEDFNNARIVIVDPKNARVVRAFSNTLGHMPGQACFDDGTFVVEHINYENSTNSRSISYHRLRTDGSEARGLLTINRTRERIREVGSPKFAVTRSTMYFGDPYFSEVRFIDTLGRAFRVTRTKELLVRLSDAEVAGSRGFEAAKGAPPPRKQIEGTHRRPFFSRIAGDTDGRLWIRDPDDPAAQYEVWTSFESTGKLQGQLRIKRPPLGQHFHAVGFSAGKVLIRRDDENGNAYIERYKLLQTSQQR